MKMNPSLNFAAPDIAELAPQPSTVFQKSQGKKTIDVYWLSDDGGLTSPSLSVVSSISANFLTSVFPLQV